MIVRVKGNKLFLYGTIWDSDGVYFMDVFTRIDSTFPEIELHLHSNGGSVFDGNLIFNAVLNAQSAVDIYVDGVACSMAAILLLAARKVYIVENGFIMIHQPSGYTWGNAKQHENNAALLRSIENNFVKKIMARTGMSEKEARKLLDGDNWFNAEQALAAKLVDGIIDPVAQAVEVDDAGSTNLESRYNSFAALLLPESNSNNNSNNENTKPLKMKKDIIAKFGLVGVNEQSSDTAVIQAMEDHLKAKTSALETSLTAKTAEVANLETAINTERDAQIKSMLDAAQTDKKIEAAQRETYENIGKTSGIQALQTVLSGLGARTPITAVISGGGTKGAATAGRDAWDWDTYQKEDPKGLEAMAEKEPEKFKELFNAKYKN